MSSEWCHSHVQRRFKVYIRSFESEAQPGAISWKVRVYVSDESQSDTVQLRTHKTGVVRGTLDS